MRFANIFSHSKGCLFICHHSYPLLSVIQENKVIFIIITNINQIILLASSNSPAVSHYTQKIIQTRTLVHLALGNLDPASLFKLIFYHASLCSSTAGIPALLIPKRLYLLFPLTGKSRSPVFNSFRSFLICHLLRKADVMATLYKTATSTSAPAWTCTQSPTFPSFYLLHNPHSVFVLSSHLTYSLSFLLKGKLPERRTIHSLLMILICSQCLMKYLYYNFLPLCLLSFPLT